MSQHSYIQGKIVLRAALAPHPSFAKALASFHGVYFPKPTCAVNLNPDGTVNGPANADLFSSEREASILKASLVDAGICKAETVSIVDDPNSESSAVRYCNDLRKILVIKFSRPLTRAITINFACNVQLLYTELMRLPYPGSHWVVSNNNELNRPGQVVG